METRTDVRQRFRDLEQATALANQVATDNHQSAVGAHRTDQQDSRLWSQRLRRIVELDLNPDDASEAETVLTSQVENNGAASRRQRNILRPVRSEQLPNDNVVVEVEGRSLTQRQLAEWYQTTDMQAENRRIFKARNVEINQMRRIEHRK